MTDPVSVPAAPTGNKQPRKTPVPASGRPADNVGGPGGNNQENGPGVVHVHSSSPVCHRPRTGPVVTGTGRRLGYRPLSPGSTVPTTTTFCPSSLVQPHRRQPAVRLPSA